MCLQIAQLVIDVTYVRYTYGISQKKTALEMSVHKYVDRYTLHGEKECHQRHYASCRIYARHEATIVVL